MEKNSKQREFILLRADGISFDKIVTKLKTSKPTLIQWNKLFEDDIKDLQFEAFIKIKESYNAKKKDRYETLLKQLEKIDDSILNTDLSKVSVKDLYTIRNDILYQVDKIERTVSADPKVTLNNEYGIKEKLSIKLNEIE